MGKEINELGAPWNLGVSVRLLDAANGGLDARKL
jgi:hypothetical protein